VAPAVLPSPTGPPTDSNSVLASSLGLTFPCQAARRSERIKTLDLNFVFA